MTPSLAPGLLIGPAPPANASPGVQTAGASSKSTSSKTGDQSPQDAFAALLQTATQEAASTQGGGEPTGPPTGGAPSTPEDTTTVSDLLAQLMALAQGLPDEGQTTDSTASTDMNLLLDRLAEAGGPEAQGDGTNALDASGAVEALMAYLVMGQSTQTDPDAVTALPADLVALLQQIEGGLEGVEGVTTDLEPVVEAGALRALAGEAEASAAGTGEVVQDALTGSGTGELAASDEASDSMLVTPVADGAADGIGGPTSDAGDVLPPATERATQSGSLGRSGASTELNAADAVSAAEAALAAQTEQNAANAADAPGVAETSTRPVAGNAGATSGVENVMAAATASQPAADATVVETASATRVATAATLPAELADSVRGAAFRGDSDIRLVLNPPELGHLDIHISRGEHGLRIVMEASQAGARELLDRSMTGLHQALEARDLRVDRLEVRATDTGRGSLDTSAGGQQPGGGAFNGSQGEDTPEWSPVAMFESANESMDMPATRPEQTSDGGASDGISRSVDVLA